MLPMEQPRYVFLVIDDGRCRGFAGRDNDAAGIGLASLRAGS